MHKNDHQASTRRTFLRSVGSASGATLAAPALLSGWVAAPAPSSAQTPATPKPGTPPSPYLSLGVDEGACVEAIVNVMCPADAHTPAGVECGLHVYIDRQLAGAWGRGDRLYRHGPWRPGKPQHGYQSALSPEQHFKAGIAALRRVALERTGTPIDQLDSSQIDALLQDVAAGRLDSERFALGGWFNEAFYPLFVQACFADPMYGGNRDKVFWRMVGYPGLPAFHERSVVEFRGRPFPASREPKSIEDFS